MVKEMLLLLFDFCRFQPLRAHKKDSSALQIWSNYKYPAIITFARVLTFAMLTFMLLIFCSRRFGVEVKVVFVL